MAFFGVPMVKVVVTHAPDYYAMTAHSAIDFLFSTLRSIALPLACTTRDGLLMTWLDCAVYRPVMVYCLFWLFYHSESPMRSLKPSRLLPPVADDFCRVRA